MRRTGIVLAAALSAAVCGPAAAADRIDCTKAMTQMDMDSCASQEFDKADARLNAAYRKLLTTLDEDFW